VRSAITGSRLAPACIDPDFWRRITAATWWSQATRSASLEPKWWITRAGDTPAASAITRTGVRVDPGLGEAADGRIADPRRRRAVVGGGQVTVRY
jgi:hypothetical protein